MYPFQSLATAHLMRDAETRSICAENPDGSRAGGARAVPDEKNPARELGAPWKVRPCVTLEPESTTVLADIAGPGVIQHIWITVDPTAYRNCVLRMVWDDAKSPSVDVPLGDFFCNGHNKRTNIAALPINVNPSGGFNSYWPMPFRSRARIEVVNDHEEAIHGFFYQITYSLEQVPDEAALFHAQWRRSVTTRDYPEHVIVDQIAGRGHYVGTYLAWTQMADGWWGEGEVKFFLDGDRDHPTICGTGTEDYVGGAWCFGDETYSAPFLGYPLYHRDAGAVPKHGMYRFHVMDPIRFREELKVTVQALGWWPGGKFQPLTDDIASVAYWYQTLPHTPFPQLPGRNERFVR